MNDDKLEPMPDPVVEEKEPNPGGADAIEDEPEDEGLTRDLNPAANPAVDEVLPEEIAEPDTEKKQAPNGQADDAEAGTETSPDAGQQAEDGSVEPPA